MHQVLLQTPYYVQELCERPHVDLWEVITLKLTEVAVIADNIGSTRRNGAIYKLVVIGVSRDEIEVIGRRNSLLFLSYICMSFLIILSWTKKFT